MYDAMAIKVEEVVFAILLSLERSGEETQKNPNSGLPVPQIQSWKLHYISYSFKGLTIT
jgi:hypothetical protein